ncbi:hypothetical protein C0583_06020 [Candidatus Parcubacteria bacterium]|nr:MAG: hypothetical protein C0583_06020 [Candidatus Parcubacteria bacterium]
MPNIMIFGMDENKASNLTSIIGLVMHDMGLQKDAIVTFVPSTVWTFDSSVKSAPYIRICSTEEKTRNEIKEKLKEANIDIDTETMAVEGFFSAGEMKTEKSK